jgi:hypothetical protein
VTITRSFTARRLQPVAAAHRRIGARARSATTRWAGLGVLDYGTDPAHLQPRAWSVIDEAHFGAATPETAGRTERSMDGQGPHTGVADEDGSPRRRRTW